MPFSNTNWITVTKKNANINETRVITRPSSVPKSVIEAFRCRGTLNSILYILSYSLIPWSIGQNQIDRPEKSSYIKKSLDMYIKKLFTSTQAAMRRAGANPTDVEVLDIINRIDDDSGHLDFPVKILPLMLTIEKRWSKSRFKKFLSEW